MSRIRWPRRSQFHSIEPLSLLGPEGGWIDTEISDIGQDSFNFQDYADELATRVRLAETPLTIGVYGSWGSGKTSLMKLLRQKLLAHGPPASLIAPIWINVWELTSQEEVGYAFLQALYSSVQKQLNLWQRLDKKKVLTQLLANSYRVILVITPMILGLMLAGAQNSSNGAADLLLTPFGSAGTLLSVGLGLWAWLKPVVEAARETVNIDLQAMLKFGPFEAQVSEVRGLRDRFEKDVQVLLKNKGGRSRLVVFIDDTDRCPPDKVADVLEVIKIFATVENCVFILGLDKEIARQGIERKYRFTDRTETDEYLEKLVQIPFHMPPLGYEQIRAFIRQEYPDVNKNCPVCPQVLAMGLQPIPRKVKLALNMYRMVLRLAHSRWHKFEMEYRVDPELLAKVAVIQSRYTDLYERLIEEPETLNVLETWADLADEVDWNDVIEESHPAASTRVFFGWLRERVRDPEMSKRIREGSIRLNELEMDAFDIDPALRRVILVGTKRFKQLAPNELRAYIYLSHLDEQYSDILYPNRQDRNTLLSGDQESIKRLLSEIVPTLGDTYDERVDVGKSYVEFLENVIEQIDRGTAVIRVSANFALDILKPRSTRNIECEPVTVRIPTGTFLMGSGQAEAIERQIEGGRKLPWDIIKQVSEEHEADEYPQHEVHLFHYRIGRFPVTNREYQEFIEKSGYKPPRRWRGTEPPKGKEQHPVVNVSWEDANAYCQWLADGTGKPYRLPTEAEWEKAARGPNARVYPWGSEWDPTRLNADEFGPGDTTPVGTYSPWGDSIYGVADMAGNVWEWCEDWYDPDAYKKRDAYIKREEQIPRDPEGPPEGEARVQRGGSFRSPRDYIRSSFRGGGSSLLLRQLGHSLEKFSAYRDTAEKSPWQRLIDRLGFGSSDRALDNGFRVVISNRDKLKRFLESV